ncbi:SusE domain-containing protein [Leeuwenhoekiella sp. MAR_2009_132]|uniref:SusE domain-containing protein n=1 Tax=Leeuwenhoekiella sp. MAR_2009_132 TaxID=1392489 RepID=UPI000490F4C0|nr:SusE domain-containing protein [Leeuwenhoekiella sp. MAR_2009_132]
MISKFKQFVFLIAVVVAAACSEEDEKLTVAVEDAPLLAQLDINRVALDQTNPGNPAVTISWNKASYGLPTLVTYVVEFATEDSFENPVNALTTSNTEATLSVSALNNTANALGFVPFEWQQAYIRIKSSIGTQTSNVSYSEPIEISINPYFSYPYDDYYLVGAATAADWNNDNNNPLLFRNAFNENEYTYTGRFLADAFKILINRGAWAPQYGQDGGSLVLRATDDDPDPPVITSETAGYRTFTVNFATGAFSFEDVAAVGDAFTSVSVTGDNGSSVELTPLSFDPHIWYVRSTQLQAGSISFLANGSTTYGGSTEFSGVATVDGGNIPVPVKDDYEIWFNDITGDYAMIPLNFSK